MTTRPATIDVKTVRVVDHECRRKVGRVMWWRCFDILLCPPGFVSRPVVQVETVFQGTRVRVRLRGCPRPPAAAALMAYLKGDQAKAIIQSYGYDL